MHTRDGYGPGTGTRVPGYRVRVPGYPYPGIRISGYPYPYLVPGYQPGIRVYYKYLLYPDNRVSGYVQLPVRVDIDLRMIYKDDFKEWF